MKELTRYSSRAYTNLKRGNAPNQFNNALIDAPAINYSFRSPLRYPGGKKRAVKFVVQLFPKDLRELVSPFFGGGSIELAMAARGVQVYGFDIFSPLVEFWQCLLTDPVALVTEVKKYFPLSKERFYELQKTQTIFESKIKRAAAYYVLNRSSFSGATLSGGMSPGHPRFTLSAIDRLRNFKNSNIHIGAADFRDSLKKHRNIFAYVDPPYLIKSALYGRNGSAHKNFDHESLSAILKNRDQWILSYNDCEEIRDLYAGFQIITPHWKYGMSNDKTSKEVLIFSSDREINRF